MKIRNINDCYISFENIPGKIFGVGVTAFLRIIPAFLFKKKFEILCYKDSLDLEILRQHMDIFCLQEKAKNKGLEKLNSSQILQDSETIKHCKHYPKSFLFVYKSTKNIEKVAKKLGYTILNNAFSIRNIFENKKTFRNILDTIGIPPIPGENITLTSFFKKNYSYFSNRYNKSFVIQLPDITSGGGLGTFFIHNNKEFDSFKKNISCGIYRNKEIRSINITTFIDGISTSIIGCTTKHGTFSSSIQTQLIDISETINLNKGSGLFCGHDRSYKHFSPIIQKQASIIIEKLGKYMYAHGYKGIFGLDLLIDETNKKVYVVECNARYTGAFPMLSLLDIDKGILPMDVFHILEHLHIPYVVDFDKTNKQYKYKKNGSHIILCNKEEHTLICKKNLTPGVYSYTNNKLIYKRPGFSYADIKNNNEFIIIDGNPKKGEEIRAFSELSRFCHILFPCKIALAPNRIDKRTKNIISLIYKTFIG